MNLLLVDDHQIILDGLRLLLERERDLHVVGEARDGRSAVAMCTSLHPDVVVMDISMPGLNGTDATRQLTAKNPRTKVVALSVSDDVRSVREMFRAGASAYCLKTAAAGDLVSAIRAVAQGATWVSPALAPKVLDGLGLDERAQPHEHLTPREREVLQLVAEGYSSKEIAKELKLAVTTVETHRKLIMAKLGLSTIAELTKFAIRTGLTGRD